MWDLSCVDWQHRMRAGLPLIPDLPLFETQADRGLAYFDEFRLPDALATDDNHLPPRLGDAAGQWFRDLVRAAFGSWDPVEGIRWIRDIFCLAPKGSSKTTYAAGLMLAVMLMNRRRNCQALFIGPTQSVSDRAYEQAVGMIELDPATKKRFRTIDHEKTIVDRIFGAEMKVKTFDVSVLTGAILIFALVDELHVLGRSLHTTKVLRQIRGGLDKTPEGMLLITTTQSDDVPTGAFLDELHQARRIRDGEFRGRAIRPMLPVLYEFPPDIARDPAKWQDPQNWSMVMPNLGRSVHIRDLGPDWETERQKGEHATRVWASQHLNIEIGIGLKTQRWPGADYWPRRTDPTLTLQVLLKRSEVVIVGIDGGGLDDLLGLTVLGRDSQTKNWLAWSYGWCHKGVLERRKSIASYLEGFQKAGELSIVEDDPLVDELHDALEAENEERIKELRDEIKEHGFPADIAELTEIIKEVQAAGLLSLVAVDPAGLGLIVDALDEIGITSEAGTLIGIRQGYALMNAIKTAERRLANGTLWHCPSKLMSWCVSNVKIEPTATAIRATKQNAGDAKIDLWAAMINAVDQMALNPEPKRSVYEARGLLVLSGGASPTPQRPPAEQIIPPAAQPATRPMLTLH